MEARSQKPEEHPPVQLVHFWLTIVSEPFWLLASDRTARNPTKPACIGRVSGRREEKEPRRIALPAGVVMPAPACS
jgi:hypothetical protein